MSFNGPAILSYGTEIGRIVTGKGGRTAFLLNRTSYSITTSKHQSRVRGAVFGQVFYVDGIRRGDGLRKTGKEIVEYYLREAAEALEKSKLPRIRGATRDGWESCSRRNLEEAKRAAEFFGVRRKIDQGAIDRLAAADARAKRSEEKLRLEKEARYATLRAERAAKVAEDALLWIAGQDVETTYEFPHPLLRLEGAEVVTSKGARVPVAVAERSFRFVWERKASGWHRNGETHDVGGYSLEAVNDQGIVIGCHRISWDEIERFAKVQSWI